MTKEVRNPNDESSLLTRAFCAGAGSPSRCGRSRFRIWRFVIHSSSVIRQSASGLKLFFILLLAGLGSIPLHAATNTNTANFEPPPPPPGSIQWDNNHRINQERQELYRKRVSIPDAVSENVPRLNAAGSASPQPVMTAPTPAPADSTEMLRKIFLVAVAFVFAGALLARRFAPGFLAELNQRFNPWAPAPAPAKNFPVKVRAEEESFAEFVAAFRVGPSVISRTAAPAPEDPAREFYARAKKLLGTQRTLLADIGREAGGLARQKKLTDLRAEVSALKDAAGFPEVLPVWQVASAVEGLLKQLTDKMGNVTPSALRAVAGAVDLLDDLCGPELKPDRLTDRPLKFLVVDDDLISRQAMSLALKKTFSQPDLAVDGATALAQASQQAYDVIFLDVLMPGMDGFELCTKIRDTDLNRATPVVFVTGQSDFDARAQSTLSGGNDLMGKPFLTFEITVKALTLGLQGRLHAGGGKLFPKLDSSAGRPDSLVTFKEAAHPVASPAVALRPASAMPVPDKSTGAFLIRAATHLGPLRELCRTLAQTAEEAARQSLLADGFLRINSLTSKTGVAVAHPAFPMCVALEGLFRKLLENSKNSTASTLATVASAVDLLAGLCVPGLPADLGIHPPVRLLVVDDDLVARRVIVGALQTAFDKPESVENGEAALALAAEKPFDVIFLDVVMPGMDGFEVCSKIRETVPNRATPVVFVTAKNDFDARAEMSRSGGNDLLGKPFLTAEITVKALTFALRGRLEQLKP